MVVCGVISVGLFLGARHASLNSDGPGDPQAQPLVGSDPWQRIQLGIGQVVMPARDKQPATMIEGPVGSRVEIHVWRGTAGDGVGATASTLRSPCPIPRFLAEDALRQAFRPKLKADGWQITSEDGVTADGVPGWGLVAVKTFKDVPTAVLYGRYHVVGHRIVTLVVVGPQSERDAVRSTFERVTDSFTRTGQPDTDPSCAAV